MSKSVIEVLTEARAKVASGWCQGYYQADESGQWAPPGLGCRVCAEGAMFIATSGAGYGVRFRAWEFLQASLPFDSSTLVSFNDAPGRTQAEVLDLFDRAIAKAREPKVTTEEASRG